MAPTTHLDEHCKAILQEYKDKHADFEGAETKVLALLKETFHQTGIHVASIESRIKTRESLAGKLERKGSKY